MQTGPVGLSMSWLNVFLAHIIPFSTVHVYWLLCAYSVVCNSLCNSYYHNDHACSQLH